MSIIKSFSVGNGDTFYIKHGSDNFTIIDCCLSDDNKEEIVSEIKRESKNKGITRFISTHPDQDHFGGLVYLDNEMSLLNFYCVENEATKDDETSDFLRYCELRDSDKTFYLYKGCSRKWMNQGDDDRGSAGINVQWPDRSNTDYMEALDAAKNGGSPNNISPIFRYLLKDGASALWMGDLDGDFQEKIEAYLDIPATDILFAPHHGRKSGRVPSSLLEEIDPKIVIIGEAPSKDLDYYAGYNKITQNSAGDITFEFVDNLVHVFVSNDGYSVDFLADHSCADTYGKYIGTLVL